MAQELSTQVLRSDFYTIIQLGPEYIWAETGIVLPVTSMEEAEAYVRHDWQKFGNNEHFG